MAADGRLSLRAAVARENVVVVGLDPSRASRRAVEWAAAEAVVRKASLQIVHAYRLPSAGYLNYSEMPPDAVTALRASAVRLLESTAAEVGASHPSLTVATTLVHGDPTAALRLQSGCGRLTVIGSQGEGRVTRSLTGSIAIDLAARGHSPIALIPATDTQTNGGPVVMGFDELADESGAAEFAFEAAQAHRTRLIAVHCWTEGSGDAASHEIGTRQDLGIQERQRAAVLSRQMKKWTVLYPQVPVEQRLIFGPAAQRLLVAAEGASMLVSGSRGRSRFTGLFLGSTSQSVIARATCPVVVVRAGTSN